jgi:hypothetical protein
VTEQRFRAPRRGNDHQPLMLGEPERVPITFPQRRAEQNSVETRIACDQRDR